MIDGLGGNDVLRGMGGDDVINGGDGNDVIQGDGLLATTPPIPTSGVDTIFGGNGDDVIFTSSGGASFGVTVRTALPLTATRSPVAMATTRLLVTTAWTTCPETPTMTCLTVAAGR